MKHNIPLRSRIAPWTVMDSLTALCRGWITTEALSDVWGISIHSVKTRIHRIAVAFALCNPPILLERQLGCITDGRLKVSFRVDIFMDDGCKRISDLYKLELDTFVSETANEVESLIAEAFPEGT